MADKYVGYGGSDTPPYESEGAASNDIQAALTAAAAGETVWVDNTHSETFASGSYILTAVNATQASPVKVVSASTGNVYAAGASFQTTAPASQDLTFQDSIVWHGCTLYGDRVQLVGGLGEFASFDDCILRVGSSSSGGIRLGTSNGGATVVRNCEFWFGHVSQYVGGRSANWVDVIDCSLHASSAAVTVVFQAEQTDSAMIRVIGGDYSGANATATLFDPSSTAGRSCFFYASGVKIGASMTLGGPTHFAQDRYEIWSCGSSTDLQNFEVGDFYGKAEDETGVYRTAANSIYDQSSSHYSVKVTPAAPSSFLRPFRMLIWEQWQAANPTLTVEMFYDSATSLHDANCWLDIEHPDGTVTAQKLLATTRNADIGATPTDLTASAFGAADWTGESGSNQNFDKIAHTVSGGGAGIHRVWFCLAPGATTPIVYVCPDVDVS